MKVAKQTYLLGDLWIHACVITFLIFGCAWVLFGGLDKSDIDGYAKYVAESKYILREQDGAFVAWDNDMEFRGLAAIATTVFTSSALRSIFNLFFVNPVQRPPIYCVIVINLVAAATHDTFARGSFPVVDNCFGRKMHVMRFAEWISLVFMLMFVTNALSCPDRKEFVYSTSMQVISVLFGCGSVFACKLDWGGDNLPESDGHWMHRGSHPDDDWWRTSSFLVWSRSFTLSIVMLGISVVSFVDIYRVVALRLMRKKEDCIASDVGEVSLWCALSWTLVVAVFFLSSLNVSWFDHRRELIAHTLVDFFAKFIYANSLGDSHLQLQQVESRYTAQLAVKDQITESQSHFLRYVFHEVLVPLNTIRLGLESITMRNESKPLTNNVNDDHHSDDFVYVFNCMDEASSTMSDTLNDVLAYQNIKEAKVEFIVAPILISNIIDEIIHGFEESFQDIGLRLSSVVDMRIPKNLYGDGLRIEQVLKHFISSAIKNHGAKAMVIIAMRNNLDDERNDGIQPKKSVSGKKMISVKFSVHFKGATISPLQQKNFFEPFQHIRTGDLVSGDGTSGMGLCICKHLIELMGGAIGVESDEDPPCSSFFFILPLLTPLIEDSGYHIFKRNRFVRYVSKFLSIEEDQEDVRSPKIVRHDSKKRKDDNLLPKLRRAPPKPTEERRNSQSSDPCTTMTPTPPQPPQSPQLEDTTAPVDPLTSHASLPSPELLEVIHVLVVDDVKLNRRLMIKCVQRLGFVVDEAEDGVIALEKSSKKSFDLILMDNSMPNMTGVEATKAIRGQRNSNEEAIIFGVTGNSLSEDIEEFNAAGINEILLKPLNFNQFLKYLGKHGIVNNKVKDLLDALITKEAETAGKGKASWDEEATPPPTLKQTNSSRTPRHHPPNVFPPSSGI